MSEFNYRRYLASREWALLKEQVKERSGGICEHCGQAPYQETHHLTYERIGNEALEDIVGLCRPCHEWFSGRSDKNPLEEIVYSESISNARNDSFHWVFVPRIELSIRDLQVVDCRPWFNSGKCKFCNDYGLHIRDFRSIAEMWSEPAS